MHIINMLFSDAYHIHLAIKDVANTASNVVVHMLNNNNCVVVFLYKLFWSNKRQFQCSPSCVLLLIIISHEKTYRIVENGPVVKTNSAHMGSSSLILKESNQFKAPTFVIILYVHSEKSPARPMLFYSTNYWYQLWEQFVV